MLFGQSPLSSGPLSISNSLSISIHLPTFPSRHQALHFSSLTASRRTTTSLNTDFRQPPSPHLRTFPTSNTLPTHYSQPCLHPPQTAPEVAPKAAPEAVPVSTSPATSTSPSSSLFARSPTANLNALKRYHRRTKPSRPLPSPSPGRLLRTHNLLFPIVRIDLTPQSGPESQIVRV